MKNQRLIIVKDNTVQPYSFEQLKKDNPNISFPSKLDYSIREYNVFTVHQTPLPEYDEQCEIVREIEPELVDGEYLQKFVVEPLSAEQLELQKSEQERLKSHKVDSLWKAADDYIARYISGVAIGILAVGVTLSKPKAIAVSNWTQSIWAEYYIRKEKVTTSSNDNLDYSMFGVIPFSVLELKEEVGL